MRSGLRFLLDEDLNPAVAEIGRNLNAGEAHPGVLIVPYSLPNNRPNRIAHALESWVHRPGDPGPCFVAFLSA